MKKTVLHKYGIWAVEELPEICQEVLLQEYAKQSKQDEVKCMCKQPRLLGYGNPCLDCGRQVSLLKPQVKEQPKGRVDIEQLPQRQDSLTEQLRDLRLVANKLGMYDAADYIKETTLQDNGLREAAERVVELETLCAEAMGEMPKEWRDRFRNVLNSKNEKND